MINYKPKTWSNGVIEGGFVRDNLHEQIQELDKKINLLSGNIDTEFITNLDSDIKNVKYEILQSKELISINDRDIDNIRVDIQNIIDNMPSDYSNELELLDSKINNAINQHISDFNNLNNKVTNLETGSGSNSNNGSTSTSHNCLDETFTTKPFQTASDELIAVTHFDRNREETSTYKEWIEYFAEASSMNLEVGFVLIPKTRELDTRVTALETALPNTGSGSKDCLGEQITVKPFVSASDELVAKIGMTKDYEFTKSVREYLQDLAPNLGTSVELYTIDKPKIKELDTRVTELENRIAALEAK